jgi:hypothetical protein
MIPIEVATIKEILLELPVTHSEQQALKWAWDIVDGLNKQNMAVVMAEPAPGHQQSGYQKRR